MRKGMAQGLARPTYFDRNGVPTAIAMTVNASAPNIETVRASYTVPAGRKAYLSAVWLWVRRMTAAAPAALAYSDLRYTPNGGTNRYMSQAPLATNGVNDFSDRTLTGFDIMSTGDNIQLVQADGSTGGTCEFFSTAKYTEFDA